MTQPDETAWPSAIGTPYGPDAFWRALSEAGNRALAQGDMASASRSYELALAEAERLLTCAQEQTAALLLAPMTLTISFSNLAEMCLRADDRAGAVELKRQAVHRLMAIATDRETRAALRLNCVRHLEHALVILAEDTAEDPSRQAGLAALTSRARSVTRETLAQLGSLVEFDDDPAPMPALSIRH